MPKTKKKAPIEMPADDSDFTDPNLVVPSNLRSIWWQYFGFAADGNSEILTKKFVICKICHKSIKYHRSTTNLRNHLSTHHPEVRMPQTRDRVEMEIDYLFQSETLEMTERLIIISKMEKYSLSLYKWGDVDRQEFITISMNTVTKDCCHPQINGDIYDFFEIQTETVTHRLNRLDLSNCTAVVVNFTDDEQLQNYFWSKKIPIVLCLLSAIQNAVEECFQLTEVNDVGEAALFVVRRFKLNFSNIRQDLWITQWNALQYFCDMSDKSSEYIEDDTVIEILSSVQEIVEILRPLKLAVDTLALEKNPIACLSKPFVTQLIENHLNVCVQDYFSDNQVASTAEMMHTIITRHLDEHIIKNEFLSSAMFFDPRFHGTAKIDNIPSIRSNIEMLIDNQNSSNKSFASKRSHQYGLAAFFSNNEPSVMDGNVPVEEEIDLEIIRYQGEPSLPFQKCPLEWWNEHHHIYPNLTIAAETYLCVPFAIDRLCRRRLKVNIDERRIHSGKCVESKINKLPQQ